MKHLTFTFIFILLFAGLAGTTFCQTDQSETEKRASESAYGVWTAVKSYSYPNFPLAHGDSVWTWEEDSQTTDFAYRYAKYGYTSDHSLGIGGAWNGESDKIINFIHRTFDEPVQIPESGLKIYWDIKLAHEQVNGLAIHIIFIIDGVEYRPNQDGGNATADSWTTQWFYNFESQDGNHTILNITEFSEFYIRLGTDGDNEAYFSHIRFNDSTMICLTGNSITGFESKQEKTPNTFFLEQNYPNPFNPVTNIGFYLPKSSKVKLRIYDSIGRFVSEVINEQMTTGKHTVRFNARIISSGIYYYKIQASDFTQVRKMLVLK